MTATGTAKQRTTEPIRAVDRVVRLDESTVTTEKAVTGNEAFFPGHYPGNPVFPGVFILESAHQAVLLLGCQRGLDLRLARIESTRFLQPVRPGDVLRSEVLVLEGEPGWLEVRIAVTTSSGKVAEIRAAYQARRRS